MSGWLVAAGLSAALAVALLVPPRSRLHTAGADRIGLLAGVRILLLALGGVGVAAVSGMPGQRVALLGVLAAALLGAHRLAQRGRAVRAAAARRQKVVDACEVLVGELRAGRPALSALEAGVEVWAEMAPVARAAHLDGDVPAALRELADRPGAEEVGRVAAAWQLSLATGAGLAAAMARVLESARARQATDRLVQAELASARATARLVVALPVVVLLASDGMGADPWGFLLDTWPGVLCLAGGVGLALGGLEWIERIAGRAAGGAG